jgi:hypothetical protein
MMLRSGEFSRRGRVSVKAVSYLTEIQFPLRTTGAAP